MPGEQGTPGDVGAQVSVNTVKDRRNCVSLFSLLLLFWTISTGDKAPNPPLTPQRHRGWGRGKGRSPLSMLAEITVRAAQISPCKKIQSYDFLHKPFIRIELGEIFVVKLFR